LNLSSTGCLFLVNPVPLPTFFWGCLVKETSWSRFIGCRSFQRTQTSVLQFPHTSPSYRYHLATQIQTCRTMEAEKKPNKIVQAVQGDSAQVHKRPAKVTQVPTQGVHQLRRVGEEGEAAAVVAAAAVAAAAAAAESSCFAPI